MYLYILRCGGNLLYTGIAADPEKRLRQHLGITAGGAKFTKSHKVTSVAAVWQDKSEKYARRLEYHIKKRLSHTQKQYLVDNPDTGFSEIGIDIPSDGLVYVCPDYLNEKYNLDKNCGTA